MSYNNKPKRTYNDNIDQGFDRPSYQPTFQQRPQTGKTYTKPSTQSYQQPRAYNQDQPRTYKQELPRSYNQEPPRSYNQTPQYPEQRQYPHGQKPYAQEQRQYPAHRQYEQPRFNEAPNNYQST